MISLSLSDILPFLLMGARWTLLLSAIAFLGGGIGALLLLLLRYGRPRFGAKAVHLYVEVLQGTPLLLQLFLLRPPHCRGIAAVGRRRRADALRWCLLAEIWRWRRCDPLTASDERRSGLNLLLQMGCIRPRPCARRATHCRFLTNGRATPWRPSGFNN